MIHRNPCATFRLRLVSISCLATLLLGPPGCTTMAWFALWSDPRKSIVIAIDVTRSIKTEEGSLYLERAKELIQGDRVRPTLVPGDRLAVGLITENARAAFPARVVPPKGKATTLDFEFKDTKRRIPDEEEAKAKRAQILAGLTLLLATTEPGNETPILEMLRAVENHFTTDKRPIRWLWIMSDMLQDSGGLDFDRLRLDQVQIDQIISKLRKSGDLPSLDGVCVSVMGASPRNDVAAFWAKYFEATGATLERGHYAQGRIWPSFDECSRRRARA